MPSGTHKPGASRLSLHAGQTLLTAAEALLKGLLESETAVAVVAGPRQGPFRELFAAAADEVVADLLRRHELAATPTPRASRAVTVARHAARSARAGLALVPNRQLMHALPALRQATGGSLERGGALVIALEDDPVGSPECSPLAMARQLDLPCLAPADVGQLRDAIDTALRLSRAATGAVGLLVHASILNTTDTVEARPNRVIESVDAMLARRRLRRRPRFAETRDVLRLVRRLELNRAGSLPNPGERVAVGFIAAGPAAAAMAHVAHALRLTGRLPLLQAAAVHPVDPVVVSRLLGRCEQVVVLETRPGELESAVLEVAESMRRSGQRPGTVWGRVLPPVGDDPAETMSGEETIHPSRLVRRVFHLLQCLRAAGHLRPLLVDDPPPVASPPPARGTTLGPGAAEAFVRRMIAETDQWLREQSSEDGAEGGLRTALAVDGAWPGAAADRVVTVELWGADRFRHEGFAALRHAAREQRPWLFVLCDVGGEEEQDLRRLADGLVPPEHADRVQIEEASLTDRGSLAELLRESAMRDRLTVLIVRDGPPARYDVASIERGLTEIDRLGFQPRQRVIWPASRPCAVRPPTDDEQIDQRTAQDDASMQPRLRVDHLPRRVGGRFRLSVRPMLEQVEVARSRPPARRWRRRPSSKLPPPEIVHRAAGQWRAHLAGFRGEAPGLVARILCEAGRAMGYAVRAQHEPAPIGAGRRAWVQLLFTRPREGERPPPLTARTPYGEADLLLGLDVAETLEAIACDPGLRVAVADRTHAAVNIGRWADEADTEPARQLREQLRQSLRDATRAEPRLVEDFADACRAWFHTDRLADMALLGAAFQCGLIPVTVDAVETAIGTAASGFGRAMEAFVFGRHLVVDHRLFSRPKVDRAEDLDRTVRRLARLAERPRRWGRGGRSQRVGRLLEEGLRQMPGLTETDAGRQARRDFVMAGYRCLLWGGSDYAERYVQLITDLYRADRGATGRSLTRNAILPLAAAMLIEDPVYIAAMATSAEQRRRMRRLLNVKRAREDQLTRRFMTRIELIALGRRVRADVRTSDWPARLVAAARHLVSHRWRGTRRQRELRDQVIALVERAASGPEEAYGHYQNAFARLQQQAIEDRLRGMALAELQMLTGEEAS